MGKKNRKRERKSGGGGAFGKKGGGRRNSPRGSSRELPRIGAPSAPDSEQRDEEMPSALDPNKRARMNAVIEREIERSGLEDPAELDA